MNVKIKQVEGLTFIGKADTNHWVTVDGPEKFNGSDAASRPMELLLIALGSCTASDVASIIKKMRFELNDFQVNVSGKRAQDHPKVFTEIYLEYIFKGEDLKEEDIKKAIELSQNKYCPIISMLNESVNINYSFTVNG